MSPTTDYRSSFVARLGVMMPLFDRLADLRGRIADEQFDGAAYDEATAGANALNEMLNVMAPGLVFAAGMALIDESSLACGDETGRHEADDNRFLDWFDAPFERAIASESRAVPAQHAREAHAESLRVHRRHADAILGFARDAADDATMRVAIRTYLTVAVLGCRPHNVVV